MGFRAKFTTALDLRAHRPNEWVLLQPLRYWAASGVAYGVPAGFVTDLASIPRPARVLFSPNGSSRRPAVLHDWLYCSRIVDRRRADDLFREALGVEGVGWITRQTLWAAVRMGGWVYWNRRTHGLDQEDFAESTDDA